MRPRRHRLHSRTRFRDLAATGDAQKPVRISLAGLAKSGPAEYGLRFAFGALVAVVAALVSLKFGARPGGLFLAFPAILPASLTLIEESEGNRAARADVVGAILGSLGLLAYALVFALTVQRIPALLSIALALGAWVSVASLLFQLTRGYPK